MCLAVGVEVGQSVQALVVLREAAQAEEQSADAQLHKQVALLHPPRRQALRHLRELLRRRRLSPALALAGRGGRRGLGGLLMGRGGHGRSDGSSGGGGGGRGGG